MPMLPDGENVKAPPVERRESPPEIPHRTVPLDTPLSLQVRLEQVDDVVRLFHDGADKLAHLLARGRSKLTMSPMANDEISHEASKGFTDAGQTHLEAIARYRDWLVAIADGLRESAARYRSTEETSGSNLRGTDGG